MSGPAAIGFAVLGIVTLLGFVGPLLPGDLPDQLRTSLAAVSGEPWAPVAAIAAYVVLASLGTPQVVLITALVVVFGGWEGFAYSWCGKVIACALGFAVGRRFGAGILQRNQNEAVAEFMRRVAKHGFLVSAGIRLVPTVPSVLVNIAAGATTMRFRDFIAGTALGSVPKMALLAFGGQAALTAVREHSPTAWVALAAIVAVWIVLAFVGRHWFKRPVPSETLKE
jgi:uncharacterized membrane protein YdjX (TVP38/TMEM64 family)